MGVEIKELTAKHRRRGGNRMFGHFLRTHVMHNPILVESHQVENLVLN